MSESFVDLAYRGLPLGRRIKLSEIRPTTGFLELSAPMPVGTKIAVATDEGVAIEAVVTQIHEQIGGSEQVPGMRIAPALAEAAAAAWWKERALLPELEPPPEPRPRSEPVRVVPRARATESPPPAPPVTMQMPAVHEALPPVAAAAEGAPAGSAEPVDPELLQELGGAEADPPLVDDGKKTVMMQSIDLRSLGLESSPSGQIAAVAPESEDDDEVEIEMEMEAGEPDEAAEAPEAAEVAEAAEPAGTEPAEAAPASANGDPRQPIVPVDRKKPHGKKRKKRR